MADSGFKEPLISREKNSETEKLKNTGEVYAKKISVCNHQLSQAMKSGCGGSILRLSVYASGSILTQDGQLDNFLVA